MNIGAFGRLSTPGYSMPTLSLQIHTYLAPKIGHFGELLSPYYKILKSPGYSMACIYPILSKAYLYNPEDILSLNTFSSLAPKTGHFGELCSPYKILKCLGYSIPIIYPVSIMSQIVCKPINVTIS